MGEAGVSNPFSVSAHMFYKPFKFYVTHIFPLSSCSEW